MYAIENYQDSTRFNEQCEEIRTFLCQNADRGFNEHFHWGRFDWMMAHSCLETDKLSQIAMFRDEHGTLVGMILFDTSYDDRWYILHSISDEMLLRKMIGCAADANTATVKANLDDQQLCALLEKLGFEMQRSEIVLALSLSDRITAPLPQGFALNPPGAKIDDWQWRLVIHRGFGGDGLPEAPGEEAARAEKRLEAPDYIKVFAVKDGEYAAHCGVWYDGGDTAYIEPVVTVPEHRGKGLGKAVVYEAVGRARSRGAKRAIVLSDQAFYRHIGMVQSSEVGVWTVKSSDKKTRFTVFP